MNSELRIILPGTVTDKDSVKLDDTLDECRHIDSAFVRDGMARLGLQAGTSITTTDFDAGSWKYGWYNRPATSITLITKLSEGIKYTAGHDDGDSENISELGFGDALVFNAASANGPRTLQKIRAKGYLSFPSNRPSSSSGSGPGSLSLARTGQPPAGGRGPEISYTGNVERKTVGDLSITEWTAYGPEYLGALRI